MAHFAKLGINSKVMAVHVLNNDDMKNADGNEDETVGQQRLQEIHGWPAQMWIQTSYNTYGGVHKLGGTPLRYNYAGRNFYYDAVADAFYEPQPFNSWTLNTNTYLWEAPVTYPTDGENYRWNETNKSWDKVE